MKRFFLIVGFLSLSEVPAWSGNLISSMTWSESGDYKMAREDQVPWISTGSSVGTFCSTCVISRAWDGTTIKLFGAKGEVVYWYTYIMASPAGNATNVIVKLSSFTGTGLAAGTGISAVAVSSSNVWDYTQRPYSLYKYSYLQQVGISQLGVHWDSTGYDQQQFPVRWQVPCTFSGNQCVATGATKLFSQMQDHNKFYPDIAVPMEEFSISSFTVSASSSQAIGGEVYISTNMVANSTYTATLTVWEGASISTTIPISLLVYNVVLPGTSTIPVLGYVTENDLAIRLNGNRSPGNFYTDPYLTSGLRAAAFLHRHKIIEIGDINPTTQDYPSAGYAKHIDGSAFKETYGLAYNTGPGYGIGDKFYMIGTYGSWVSSNWSTSTITNGSTGYCDNVSSWTFYCNNNGVNCQLYTSDDENAHLTLDKTVNTNATWSSTVTACANGGHTLPYLQTGTLPVVVASAPFVNTVLSGGWMSFASATWVTDEALYNTSSTHAAGGYNAALGVDSLFADQEEGLGPREVMWGAYKTNQKYWFLWAVNYWQDSNNPGQAQNGWNANTNNDNDTFNIAKVFGIDIYPSTSSYQGHYGNSWSAGDGNITYPGTDTVYVNPSYGFNGIIGSWRLNQLTRGIQDVDIIKLAYAVNPSSTTTIVNQQVQDVMYLRQCANVNDCTYSYGVRPWSEVLSSWEAARESLLLIANTSSPSSPPPSPSSKITIQGNVNIKGNASF